MEQSDNRIPKAVHERQAAASAHVGDWLLYEDWIPLQPSVQGRVVIAARGKHNKDSPFTLSCFISDDPAVHAKVLESAEWDIDQDEILRIVLERALGGEQTSNSLEVIPLTFNQQFLERESELGLNQGFVLIQNARRDGDEVKFVDMDGNRHTLAWYVATGGIERIEIDEHLLRTFLRDRKGSLVRYHDHHRFDKARAGSEDRVEVAHVTSSANYRVVRVIERETAMGLLRGKDIIEGYPPSGYVAKPSDLTFLIGLTDGGEPIEATCDRDQLSNLFTDRGTVNYLTDVFFRPEVLEHYYEATSDYTVADNTVMRNGIWSITYALTDDGLVHVQLGDLSQLPIVEQHHWRAHNIISHGGIPEDRFRRDFLGEWTQRADPIGALKAALVDLQQATQEKYGEPAILPLNENDEHFLAAMRIPPNDDWRAFDAQLLNIAKPIMDSINVKLLRRLVPYAGTDEDKRPPIELFEAWLVSLGIDRGDAAKAASSFRSAQSLRSASSAHRKSADLDKTIRRLGFDGIPRSRIIQGLVVGIEEAIEVAMQAFSVKDET